MVIPNSKQKLIVIITITIVLIIIAFVAVRLSTSKPTANDTTAAVLSLTSASTTQGGEITLSLQLDRNPGIVAISADITYDKAVLELVSVKNIDEVFPADALIESQNIDDIPYKMVWEDGLNPNHNNDGTLAELTFRVRDNAPTGESEISLVVNDFYDFDMNDHSVGATGGVITVNLF